MFLRICVFLCLQQQPLTRIAQQQGGRSSSSAGGWLGVMVVVPCYLSLTKGATAVVNQMIVLTQCYCLRAVVVVTATRHANG